MNMQAFEVPDAENDISDWLERQLMSQSFADFVSQLAAVIDAQDDAQENIPEQFSLEQILEGGLAKVLKAGLIDCSPIQVRQLLGSPSALIGLHQQIYESGSPYWFSTDVRNSNDQLRLDQLRLDQLKTKILQASPAASSAISNAQPSSAASPSSAPPMNRRSFKWELFSLAAAALVVAMVGWGLMSQNGSPPLAKWGWLSEEGLPQTDSRSEYFSELAAGGEAWFNKTPATPAEFEQRLREMMAGCEVLIHAEHGVLAASERKWLIEKCKSWQSKFDEQLVALRSNPENFQSVLQQTGQTVHSLVAALREAANVEKV